MTLYAETSAVLRWLFNEPLGDTAFEALQGARKVVCARLTLIECRRAARRAVVEAHLPEAHLGDLLVVLGQAAARWAVLELSPDVAERAGARFPLEPVRTLDAIHLASMVVLRESLPDLTALSMDERVRRNALALGFDVIPSA